MIFFFFPWINMKDCIKWQMFLALGANYIRRLEWCLQSFWLAYKSLLNIWKCFRTKTGKKIKTDYPNTGRHLQRFNIRIMVVLGFPADSVVKNPSAKLGAIPGSGRSHWRRKWQPTQVILPGEFHGQRSLVGYSPWDCKRVGHNLATKHIYIYRLPRWY